MTVQRVSGTMSNIFEVQVEELLIAVSVNETLIEISESKPEIVIELVGPQGQQGIQGIPGPVGDISGALLVTNRLSEFNTSQMKVEARTSLELQHIDCGEFL